MFLGVFFVNCYYGLFLVSRVFMLRMDCIYGGFLICRLKLFWVKIGVKLSC